MLTRLRGIWTAPDLRNKILLTVGLLIVYRLAAYVPVPGIDPSTVNKALSGNTSLSQVFGLLSVFSGGSISNFSIVALGVYPYITASIVIQLLQPIIPALDRLGREGGDAGRNRLSQITRYIAVPLAFLQALGQIVLFASIGAVSSTQFNLLNGGTFIPTLATLTVMTTGVMFLVWIGEIITENGIGNGISLIIFTGIIAQIPQNAAQYLLGNGVGSSGAAASNNNTVLSLALFAVVVLVLMLLIVFITLAERRVPVQYPSKRVISSRRAMMETRQQSYIPLKLNLGGMIPLIFAQSLLLFPTILASYLGVSSNPIKWLRGLFQWVSVNLNPTASWYPWLFFLLVVGFTFFYADTLWEQQHMGENLQKQGAFIAGVRPGPATEGYLRDVLMRVTLWGALFLAFIAIVPYLIPGFQIRGVSNTNGLITAAALIIIVQVAMDTVKQIEAQLVMRNYSGFLT
jgi:preprotein translocase subunit SecY